MKKTIISGLVLSALYFTTACTKEEKTNEVVTTEQTATAPAQSVQQVEMYQGVLPCADCEGIFTTITLHPDQTFEQVDQYIGKDGQFTEKGKYTYDAGTQIYTLTSSDDPTPRYLMKKEGALEALDAQKKNITGATGQAYTMQLLVTDEVNFTTAPVEGFLSMGHEDSSFRPKNSTKVYWVEDPTQKLATEYASLMKGKKEPYQAVKATLVLEKKDGAPEGIAEAFDGVVVVKEIQKIEPLSLNNVK